MTLENSAHSAPSTAATNAAIITLMACAALVSLALFGVFTHPILTIAALAAVVSLALASLVLHRLAARPQYRRSYTPTSGA